MNLIGKADLLTFGESQKENIFETFGKLSIFYKWDDNERKLQSLQITLNEKANYFYDKLETDIKSSHKKLRLAIIK